MGPRRRLTLTAVLGAALASTALSTAAADPQVTDRLQTGDGTVFTLTAGSSLSGKGAARRATFRFDASPPEGEPNPYGEDGVVRRAALRLAGRQMVVVGSTIGCGDPGASAMYGTVVRRARRVVATLVGGRDVRLVRRKAPKAWKYPGWVVGAVVDVRRAVREVRAYDARDRRIARATFDDPPGC
jgi:hypothetical protein